MAAISGNIDVVPELQSWQKSASRTRRLEIVVVRDANMERQNMAKPNPSLSFSHVGICVADLDRSLRFYCQGLGFELVESHTVGTEFGKLMEVAGNIVLQSRFVARDGVR